MSGHDPQRTSHSPASGPIHPHLLWTKKRIYVDVVGPDGRMYGGVSGPSFPDGSVVALDAQGRRRWTYRFFSSDVAVAPNGNVLAIGFTRSDAATIALSPNGTLVWKIQPFGLTKGDQPLVTESGIFYAPIVGPNNGSPNSAFIGLNIISPAGQIIRRLPLVYKPALGPDGTMYSAADSLQARDPNGRLLWQHHLPQYLASCLLVGKDGSVYVGYGGTVASYAPSGRLLWRKAIPDAALALAERSDGVLLVAGRQRLIGLHPDGTRLWMVRIGKTTNPYEAPSLVVDRAGTAYIGTGDGRVRVISAKGKVLARLFAGGRHHGFPPIVLLGPGGRLIVTGTDEVLRVYGRLLVLPNHRSRYGRREM